MTTKTLDEADLRQFTGSEQWYRHGLVPKVMFTDGAKHVADEGGAYWLLDEIALAQKFDKKVAAEEFQVWTLLRDDAALGKTGNGATLTCDDGNDNVVSRKHIEFTDFPLPQIKLYCTGNTIMLPSEY
jgi:hypothetical protein